MNLVLEDQAKDGTDGAHHHAHHAQGHAQPGATTDKAAEMPAGNNLYLPHVSEGGLKSEVQHRWLIFNEW